MSTISESVNTESKKYYLRFETDESGIRRFNAMPESERDGAFLGSMRKDGIIVPAIIYEVDAKTYYDYQRNEWKSDNRRLMENRCTVGGDNGKAIRCPARIPNPDYTGAPGQTKTIAVDCEHCPYGNSDSYKPLSGSVYFSTLSVTDSEGNSDPYEPEAPDDYYAGDRYLDLLYGLIDYIKENYPHRPEYADLTFLLGQEINAKEAADMMDTPYSTVLDWRKKLRPIVNEYLSDMAI